MATISTNDEPKDISCNTPRQPDDCEDKQPNMILRRRRSSTGCKSEMSPQTKNKINIPSTQFLLHGDENDENDNDNQIVPLVSVDWDHFCSPNTATLQSETQHRTSDCKMSSTTPVMPTKDYDSTIATRSTDSLSRHSTNLNNKVPQNEQGTRQNPTSGQRSSSSSFYLWMGNPSRQHHDQVRTLTTTTVSSACSLSEFTAQQDQQQHEQEEDKYKRFCQDIVELPSKQTSSSVSLVSMCSETSSVASTSASSRSASVSRSSTSSFVSSLQQSNDGSIRSTRSLPIDFHTSSHDDSTDEKGATTPSRQKWRRKKRKYRRSSHGNRGARDPQSRHHRLVDHHRHRVIPTPVSQRILERECSLLKPTLSTGNSSATSITSSCNSSVGSNVTAATTGSNQRSLNLMRKPTASTASSAASYTASCNSSVESSGTINSQHSMLSSTTASGGTSRRGHRNRRHHQQFQDMDNNDQDEQLDERRTRLSSDRSSVAENDTEASNQVVEDNCNSEREGRSISRFLGTIVRRARSRSISRERRQWESGFAASNSSTGESSGLCAAGGNYNTLLQTTPATETLSEETGATIITTQYTRRKYIRNWMGMRRKEIRDRWNAKDAGCLMFD